jgi:hypothetical protein
MAAAAEARALPGPKVRTPLGTGGADHNCLQWASAPLDIRKSGVIAERTAKGTIIGLTVTQI